MNKLIDVTRVATFFIIGAFIVMFARFVADLGYIPNTPLMKSLFDIVFMLACGGYIVYSIIDVVAYGKLKDSRKTFRTPAHTLISRVCFAFLIAYILMYFNHVTLPATLNDLFNLFWYAFVALSMVLTHNDYMLALQQQKQATGQL